MQRMGSPVQEWMTNLSPAPYNKRSSLVQQRSEAYANLRDYDEPWHATRLPTRRGTRVPRRWR
ncbi:hypothetical protein MOPEL_021_00100 [Mobilicoccus pelagius NBRC 104925]|uniref:Uncharacterized protein n=1 Tax=Mobilicoccus pelagius NBRC 104925 TaxID=1089455 RepID=H5UPB7_9MICO|nr:hypothetical protein MOPEL_021_00100 [Mobilicoccus pelagius NBRC 104925]